ncbi:aminopeptidase N-like [Formica exsecta]|uniref:aminopeptidase N-like n=1 Tax=Formica exsecta TaxID=72781 RepID=UPI00114243ED|nr:aminopeptidase N-like [Formica exsecta]
MLNGTLPRNSMLMGLNTYFNTRFPNFNSPTPDDLWSFIQTGIDDKLKNKLYNLSIKQIMDIWITQTYCPVVNVKRDYSDNLVKISKEINDKLDRKPYFIPVSYVKETNINFVNISLQSFNCLTQSNPEMKINYDSKDKWFMANILQTGYYRVNYDTENWRMIARYLKSKKYENIHVINRAQIIDDAFHLTIEKKLDFSIFWELASYLPRERNYVAWYPMIKVFERISSVFAFSTHHEHLKKIKMLMGSLFKDIDEDMYDQMGPANEDLNKYLKQELTKWGCLINNSWCLKMAKKQFEWHRSDPETRKVFPGWEKLISCNSLKTVSYRKWFSIWTNTLNIYEKKSDYEIMKYLSCSDDPQIILTYLKFNLPTLQLLIIKDKNMDFETLRREKERIYALTTDIFFSTLAMHAKNPIILKDILENFEIIKNRLIISDNNSNISTIATLIVIINNVYSKNELDMINKFAKNMTQLISDIERKITTRLLEIESQIKYYQTVFPQSSLITIDSITIRRTTTRLSTTLLTTVRPTKICPTTTRVTTTTHPTTTRPTTTPSITTTPTPWNQLVNMLLGKRG